MPDPAWSVLIIDDDVDLCGQIAEFLQGEDISGDGEPVHVTTNTDFDDGLVVLEREHFDLLILDLRRGGLKEGEGDDAGLQVLQAIKLRRFIPVVFYTALPKHIPDGIKTPLVRVVGKNEGLGGLLTAVKEIFATKLPRVNRGFIRHVEGVQREYMWEFVAKNWAEFGTSSDHTSIAYFLARRLAMSLSDAAVGQFVLDLGGDMGSAALTAGHVHPMRLYVMPPLHIDPLVGELFRGDVEGGEGYWILLTPSCDLAQKKADRVVLAKAELLTDMAAHKAVHEGKADGKLKDALKDVERLLSNSKSDRYFYLPECLEIPDLIIDLQHLVGCPCEVLDKLHRVATLDSPFAESLVARFLRYFGRLGTPDLDVLAIMQRLYPKPDGGPAKAVATG